MPVFSNLNNLRTYMEALKEIDKAKEIGYSLEIRKFHPVATDMQKAYLAFIITYLSSKLGQTFYQTLSEIQKNVAPHIFMTGEYDIDFAESREIMIPDKEDELAVKYCQREVESSKGWV